MVVFIISVIISVMPSIFLYKWLVKSKNDQEYKSLCKIALKKGILSVLFIFLVSFILFIIGKLLMLLNINIILYEAYYTFIVLALSEELVKYFTFKSILNKTNYKYNYFDAVVFMSIVGLGFGIIENITFSINSGIIPMLIKGIDLAHVGYGFIVGYFYGKSLESGNKGYRLVGFLIAWFLHGMFDFGLSDALLALNDNLAFISIGLSLVSLITIIILIKYVRRERPSIN